MLNYRSFIGLLYEEYMMFLLGSIGYIRDGQTIYTWEYLKRLYKASLLKKVTSYYKWKIMIYESNVKVSMEIEGLEVP